MKQLIVLFLFCIHALAATYPDSTTSVVLKNTSGATINMGRYGPIENNATVEIKLPEVKDFGADSRFAVVRINGTATALWGTATPEASATGWPGWTFWDLTANTLYVKDTGEGTTTGWILTGGAGGIAPTGTVVRSGSATAGYVGIALDTSSTNLIWTNVLSGLTIVTPTIASLANANHTHLNAAGGGTLDAAVIAAGTIAAARLPSLTVLTTLGDAETITGLDLSVSDEFIVTLAGNRTLPTPSNIPAGGKTFTVWFVQDDTGERTITHATNYMFGTTITATTLTTNSTLGDMVRYRAFSTNSVVRVVDFVKGFQF